MSYFIDCIKYINNIMYMTIDTTYNDISRKYLQTLPLEIDDTSILWVWAQWKIIRLNSTVALKIGVTKIAHRMIISGWIASSMAFLNWWHEYASTENKFKWMLPRFHGVIKDIHGKVLCVITENYGDDIMQVGSTHDSVTQVRTVLSKAGFLSMALSDMEHSLFETPSGIRFGDLDTRANLGSLTTVDNTNIFLYMESPETIPSVTATEKLADAISRYIPAT